MRKVVVSEFVSLDRVMEDPIGESPFRGEEQETRLEQAIEE